MTRPIARHGRAEFVLSGVLACAILAPQAPILMSTAGATEYCVGLEGRDDDPGTVSRPWRTLDKANRTLQPGDTLLIRTGIFDEIIEPFHSGMPGRPIVYRNYPHEQVTLRGLPNAEAIVSIGWDITGGGWEGKSYIVVEGLSLSGRYHTGKVDGEHYPSHVLVYGPGSTHNEIRKCLIQRDDPISEAREHGETEYAIAISKASYNVIEGNRIRGMTRIGIIVAGGGRGNVIRDNRVLDCLCSSVDIGSSMGVVQGTLIENNVLGDSITEDGIQFEPDYSLMFDDGSNRGVVIRRNVICGNAENAIDLKGGSQVLVEENLILGNRGDNRGAYADPPDRSGGTGGVMHGSSAGSKNVIVRKNVVYDNLGGIDAAPGYKIYNNVVIFNNRDYTGPDSDYGTVVNREEPNDADSTRAEPDLRSATASKPVFAGISVHSGPNDVAILNNIVGGHRGAEIVLGPQGGARLRIDRNLYFNLPDARFTMFLASSGWETVGLQSWRMYLLSLPKVIGSDLHSRSTSPLFQDPCDLVLADLSNGRFCPCKGSPAIDSGDFLTRTVSAGSGVRIEVEDVGFFCDGFGAVPGDMIQLEGREERYRIGSIDRDRRVLVVDRILTWAARQGVALAYSGLASDIGACECEGGL